MYFQLAKYVFSQQFQYRESVLFKLAGNFLWIYIQICIWQTLLPFQSGQINFPDMVVYTVAAFSLNLLSSSTIATVLSEKVKSGSIATDLIRPVNMKWYLLCEQLSTNVFQWIFTGFPVIILVFIIWPGSVPVGINLLISLISMGLSIILVFYFQYTIGLLVFWFKDGTYARMLTSGLMDLFSGRRIPLWFYPTFLKGICVYLPFRFMVYEPIAILLGKYEVSNMFFVIGMQFFWILLLTILEKLIWSCVQKQIEVQGG